MFQRTNKGKSNKLLNKFRECYVCDIDRFYTYIGSRYNIFISLMIFFKELNKRFSLNSSLARVIEVLGFVREAWTRQYGLRVQDEKPESCHAGPIGPYTIMIMNAVFTLLFSNNLKDFLMMMDLARSSLTIWRNSRHSIV